MKQLHLVRARDDPLAREVIEHQLRAGDEVRVVLLGEAAGDEVPEGAEAYSMPPLKYDAVVELLEWCDRVVSW